jgi:hypothetical protein
LWAQLAERGGGQLDARADGLTGAFNKLKNSTNNLFQSSGQLIAEFTGLDTKVRVVAGAMSWLNSLISQTPEKSRKLKNAVLETGAAMESKEEIVRRYAKSYDHLRSSAQQAANELERATAAIRAKAQQENSVAGARAEARLKRVDMDEKSGRITPTRAATLRTQIQSDLEAENFQREKDARDKEIKLVGGQAGSLNARVDDANRKAAAEKEKYEKMQGLARQRSELVRGGSRVDLMFFDTEHGKIDLAGQQEKMRQAREFAKKVNQEVYPQVGSLNARRIALQNEQSAEMRKRGFVRESNRLDSLTALDQARETERGRVQRNDDGSISIQGGTRSGNAAAVAMERQSAALTAATPNYPIGSPRDRALLAQRDRQIATLQDIVNGISKLSTITPAMENRLRAALDRIDVLESQNRNRSNR